ncbi:allophanate hydrolase subunit 1 [Nocardia sp. NPDC052566]|uniref:allophanate hydrolase subunit 1 n=1 Tax=Nocardia sp. NPDC052566 TaxID=3364330 RepID=UPI0037C99463
MAANSLEHRTPRILPAGDRSVLVDPDDEADLSMFVDALRFGLPDGVHDVLPAARTVLVTLTEAADRTAVTERLRRMLGETGTFAGEARARAEDEVVTIPVRYQGPDLEDVAAHLGIGVREVITAHTGALWRCSFVGFAPGFGYLESAESPLAVPRRVESRTSVPAGSVALADGYSAVYPRRSPGGWQLIGSTDIDLWDLARAEPSLLRPGTKVRFIEEAGA